jgi:hypothetical protein
MKVEFLEGRMFGQSAPDLPKHSAEVIFVMPFLDRTMAARSAGLMSQRAGADGLIIAVHDQARDGFICVANRVFDHTDSRYFGYVAQDAFAGRHWLNLALKTLRKQALTLLAFNDGKWLGSLAAFGLAERAWARGNYGGKFFFPGYRRHYADVELSVLAMSQKQFGYNANSVLMEVDWNKEHSSVNLDDKALYHRRRKEGFGNKVNSQAILDMFC